MKLKARIHLILLMAALSSSGQNCSIQIEGNSADGQVRTFWQVANFTMGKTRTFAHLEDVDTFRSHSPFCKEVVIDYALGGRYPESEEYFFGTDDNGELITDFSELIKRITVATEAGFTPWIGLENVPPLMCNPPKWSHYGVSSPPADYDLFHRYVRHAMETLMEHFGREEMAGWRFIVATEPDLYPGHWTGTREEFFELLDHTLSAVLEVLPEADISPGNILNPGYKSLPKKDPGEDGASLVRSRDNWGLDIIDHMASGSIHPQGGPGSKLSFFSYSWYARIGRSMDVFDRAINKVRQRLNRYPQYRSTPIDMREFGILKDDKNRRLYGGDASEWGASFYAAIARRVYDYGIRFVFEWDHATMGVLHPRGQVIAMLDRMAGGDLLEVDIQQPAPDSECGAIASRKADCLYVLVYNHKPERKDSPPVSLDLQVSDSLFSDTEGYLLSEWLIDKDHASWMYAFLEDAKDAGVVPLEKAGLYEGSPRRLLGERGFPLFEAGIRKYRHLSKLPQTRDKETGPVVDGRIQINLDMRCHSVRLLKLSPME